MRQIWRNAPRLATPDLGQDFFLRLEVSIFSNKFQRKEFQKQTKHASQKQTLKNKLNK